MLENLLPWDKCLTTHSFFQSSLSGLGERYNKEYSTSGTSMAAVKVNIWKFSCFLLNNGWMCVCVRVCVLG